MFVGVCGWLFCALVGVWLCYMLCVIVRGCVCLQLWVVVGYCGLLWVVVGCCVWLWVFIGGCGWLWVVVGAWLSVRVWLLLVLGDWWLLVVVGGGWVVEGVVSRCELLFVGGCAWLWVAMSGSGWLRWLWVVAGAWLRVVAVTCAWCLRTFVRVLGC